MWLLEYIALIEQFYKQAINIRWVIYGTLFLPKRYVHEMKVSIFLSSNDFADSTVVTDSN